MQTPEVAKSLFFTVTLLKVLGYLIFVYSGAQFWTPITDANFYDAIARGVIVQEHPWGDLLKAMNDRGLYSRAYISTFIFALNCTLVPWLMAKICVGADEKLVSIDWYFLLMVTFYPTMTVFSVDVFRDTPMVVCFLFFLLAAKYLLSEPLRQWRSYKVIGSLGLAVISCYLIYSLRFYLAAALIAAMVASCLLDISKRPWLLFLLYLLALSGVDVFGGFDLLKGAYRQTYEGAGSAYGINFAQGYFIVNFIQSFAYGVCGLYVYSFFSAGVFLVESAPIFCLAIYLYINRKCADRFVNFLSFFFFIYAALWVIGVDSLGTAVRYRVFNYLAILMAAQLVFKVRRSLNSENIL